MHWSSLSNIKSYEFLHLFDLLIFCKTHSYMLVSDKVVSTYALVLPDSSHRRGPSCEKFKCLVTCADTILMTLRIECKFAEEISNTTSHILPLQDLGLGNFCMVENKGKSTKKLQTNTNVQTVSIIVTQISQRKGKHTRFTKT